MSLVWDMDTSSFEKLVLLALADCANDDGECWPSIATLMRKTGAGERTIQRSIRSLESSGLVRRVEVVGKGNRYFITPATAAPRQTDAPPESALTPATAAPKPSRTTIKGLADAKPKRARKAASDFSVPGWLPAGPWAAFLEMRKQKGAWPTASAVELLVQKLDRWRAQGHDPGEILNTSTENNWTGIFEPKASHNGRSSNPNAVAGIRGSRPDPALDMFLQAQRDLQAEAER